MMQMGDYDNAGEDFEQQLHTALHDATEYLLGTAAALPQQLRPQQAVLGAILQQEGTGVFGGAVRDALLEKEAKDLDLSVTALTAVPHMQRAQQVAERALECLNSDRSGAKWSLSITTSKQTDSRQPTAQQLQRPALTLLLLELDQDGQPQVSYSCTQLVCGWHWAFRSDYALCAAL
jgi:Poly A polymerase head domain